MEELVVGALQTDLYWEDSVANLASIEEQIAHIERLPDVLVLPEMFSTGFSMEPARIAEPMKFTATRWMQQMAAQTGALIVGSIAIKEDSQYYNRLLAVKPDGTYQTYDKRHLFRMGGENEVYQAGNERSIVEWKGWKICPLVCYDLRFPVWSRQEKNNLYDILIYVANWPQARQFVWDTLLRARAIENLSYVIGVNRIGADGKQVAHQGGSAIIDFKGTTLAEAPHGTSYLQATLQKNKLYEFREKFPAYLDADTFEIKK